MEIPSTKLYTIVSTYYTYEFRVLKFERWFLVTMGTGIVAILLGTIPFRSPVLYYLSIVFFILNTIFFVVAFVVSFLRYTLYPDIWGVMIRDPVNSLFLSSIPIGFATLINMWILICVPAWGEWAKTATIVFWIIDTIASVVATLALPMVL
jgi:tellurite resistance protein TehA-like permease